MDKYCYIHAWILYKERKLRPGFFKVLYADHKCRWENVQNFTFPEIADSHAVGVLRDDGFMTVDTDGFLHLTDEGREIAEKLYERNRFLQNSLSLLVWIKKQQSRMEYVVSDNR